jgi:putative addiction module component (TIGR02574 family)
MTENARRLLEQVLKLPPAERLNLIFEALESVEDEDAGELSPEWREEIERRVEAVVSGRAGPGEDYRVVMDRIRKRYDERRRSAK